MFAPLLLAALAASPAHHAADADAAEPLDGVITLFDGSNLDAWEKYAGGAIPDAWSVEEDGSLHFSGEGGSLDLQTKRQFTDFDLRFEWKVAEGANSGVIYGAVADPKGPAYLTGPEYQILDDSRHRDGKNPKTSAASLYAMEEARPFKVCPVDGSARCPHVEKTLKAVGAWNAGRIVKDGDSLRHYLNGEKVVDVTIGSDAWADAVADSKFSRAPWTDFAGPLTRGEPGRFVLQDHGDEVWFRNVTVRPPDDDAADGRTAAAGPAVHPAERPAASFKKANVTAEMRVVEPGARHSAEAPADPPVTAGGDGETPGGADAVTGADSVIDADSQTGDSLAGDGSVTGDDLVNGADWAAFLCGPEVTGPDLVNGTDWASFVRGDD